jgi:hypothetical protein
MLRHQLDAVETKFTLQRAKQIYARTRARLRNRHHAVAHVLKDVPKVLAVPVHEDAAITTHFLRIPATEVGVEERVRHTAQCLYRRLEPVSADVELDVAFMCLLVLVHGLDLAAQISLPCIDFGESFGTLSGNLAEIVSALLGDLCNSALESRPGRRHEPRDGRAEGSLQLLLQCIQQRVEHQAEQPCVTAFITIDDRKRAGHICLE